MLAEKHARLRAELRRYRTVEVKTHPIATSVLEAVFSRGDRRLGRVLVDAWRRGARFDGWDDKLDAAAWKDAFAAAEIDPRQYLQPLARDAVLPWDHIDTRVKKSRLVGGARRGPAERADARLPRAVLRRMPRLRGAGLEEGRPAGPDRTGRRARGPGGRARGDHPPLSGLLFQAGQGPLPVPHRPHPHHPEELPAGRDRGPQDPGLPSEDGFRLRSGPAPRHGGHEGGPGIPLRPPDRAPRFPGPGQQERPARHQVLGPAGPRRGLAVAPQAAGQAGLLARPRRARPSARRGAPGSSGSPLARFKAGHPGAEADLELAGRRLVLALPPDPAKGARVQDIVREIFGVEEPVFLIRRDRIAVKN